MMDGVLNHFLLRMYVMHARCMRGISERSTLVGCGVSSRVEVAVCVRVRVRWQGRALMAHGGLMVSTRGVELTKLLGNE
jgi:hypothetical protein